MKEIFKVNNDIDTTTVIAIPDFAGDGEIYIRVRRPTILKFVENGEIPNPLMGAAAIAVNGTQSAKTDDYMKTALQSIDFINLYCKCCLVEPTYEEFNPIMTDEQRTAITAWALTPASKLRLFRKKEENDTDNSAK